MGRFLTDAAVRGAHDQGFGDVRESWVPLLRHIEGDGIRCSDLARRLGVTKQAAQQLTAEIEALGYVERVPDPSDGRARIIRLTAKGWQSWLAGLRASKQMEARLRASLGASDFEHLLGLAHRALQIMETGKYV
jgi:DNA-binding MarR family transcriptional regulator